MHMINSAVSDTLMPRPVRATANTPPAIGCAFVVHQLELSELATNHFLSAIINEATLGAELIKKYSSYRTIQKTLHMFYFFLPTKNSNRSVRYEKRNIPPPPLADFAQLLNAIIV
jgi:hypothetical protein